MFGKKDDQVNDRIIYQAKPNMILGCKKAIIGLILLIIVLFISGPIIQFIGQMQVYMISYVKLPLTRYTAIVVFVAILLIVIYIIWQIVGWYSREYVLTESRIIIKSGILISRKNYMPYSTIQDINTSQGIISKLFNVGSISVYSAYDNNQMYLENISDPSEVEKIIFAKITQPRAYYQPNSNNFNNPHVSGDSYQPNYPSGDDYYEQDYQSPQQNLNYHSRDDYYEMDYPSEMYYEDDDYVITPIRQEEQHSRREYDYYPEDISYQNPQRNRYEYEPYGDSLEHNINRAMHNDYGSYGDSSGVHQNESYYNEVNGNYSHSEDDYYQDYGEDYSYDKYAKTDDDSQKDHVDSSESIIQRHFDKFKK